MESFEAEVATLRQKGIPFALALVVRCESPTSAKPGARGIVSAEGEISGWIGGGCAQPVVIEEARRAIRDGTPRLVRITPQAGKADVDGIHAYEMVCYSGGTLDIFVEPVLPPPQVVILGRSPVARTLAALARTMNYAVHVYAPGGRAEEFGNPSHFSTELDLSGLVRPQQSFVVVSTQGEDDEGGMRAALGSGASYVAFVASPKKWKSVSADLAAQGIAKGPLASVRVPAGIDINAHDPEEIALSVMAQIVSVRRSDEYRSALEPAGGNAPAEPEGTSAIDPICGMTVKIAEARYRSDYKGQQVYFCCGGCKTRFDGNPDHYAKAGGSP